MPVNHAVMVAHVKFLTAILFDVFVHQDIQDLIVRHVSSLFFLTTKMKKRKPVNIGDPCLDNPCLNGGACITNNMGGFTCQCPPGYSGLRCEDRE